MMMRSIALGIFLFLCVVTPTAAQTYPKPTGFINDTADIIPDDQQASLEQQLTQYAADTKNEIAILTITSLNGENLEDYSVKVFEEWGIGKRAEDNGLLILVAKDERKVRIEVGYGLEPFITDGVAGDIIRTQIGPAFKEERYGEGLTAAVQAIQERISSKSTEEPVSAPLPNISTNTKLEMVFYALFAGMLLLSGIAHLFARSKSYWLGGVLGGGAGALIGGVVAGTAGLLIGAGVLGLILLILDYLFSTGKIKPPRGDDGSPGMWFGRGGFGGDRGFGGFGGGRSGGGGASGGW